MKTVNKSIGAMESIGRRETAEAGTCVYKYFEISTIPYFILISKKIESIIMQRKSTKQEQNGYNYHIMEKV